LAGAAVLGEEEVARQVKEDGGGAHGQVTLAARRASCLGDALHGAVLLGVQNEQADALGAVPYQLLCR
jgi:hypothetical protein